VKFYERLQKLQLLMQLSRLLDLQIKPLERTKGKLHLLHIIHTRYYCDYELVLIEGKLLEIMFKKNGS
jgi:hypothetical protein